MKKIVFYYTNYNCPAHPTRLESIIHALKKKAKNKIRIYLYHRSDPPSFLRKNREAEHVYSPYLLPKRDVSSGPASNFFEREKNIRSLLEKVRSIRPDAFISDFNIFESFNVKRELFPVLHFLKANGKKVFCSNGYPVFTEKKIKDVDFFLKYYDRFLFHIPYEEFKNAYTLEKYISLFKNHKEFVKKFLKKAIFTNYIVPVDGEEEEQPSSQAQEKKSGAEISLLAYRGEVIYYPKIIINAILASRQLPHVKTIVIPGPATTVDNELTLYRKLQKKYKNRNLVYKENLNHVASFVKKADIVLTTATYNMAALILRYKKKAIIVPSQAGRSDKRHAGLLEQPVRSEILRKNIGSVVVDYRTLTSESLKKIVCRLARDGTRKMPVEKNIAQGADITAGIILSRLNLN